MRQKSAACAYPAIIGALDSRSMRVVLGEWEASAERGRVREGSDGDNSTSNDLREG